MRTTLTIDDQIVADLRRLALDTDRTFKKVVNDTLQAGLRAGSASTERYRLRPSHLGGVRAGIDPDRTLRVADALEDDEILRELQSRK